MTARVMRTAELAVIVAVSKNGVIGRNNALPWQLRADLKWFKQVTTGNTIVMGRKTYESIGRPLPNRDNIVLSRRGGEIEGCRVCQTLDSAVAQASRGDVFVIGGAQIYRYALPMATRLFLTVVDAQVEGDTWLPFIDLEDWERVAVQSVEADAENEFACELREYRRRRVDSPAR
ncbi:MAG: dihydrofolate reductase [Pseudomonadota bacterium]